MTAGTPSLNRPLDRSEAEARIERALKVALEERSRAYNAAEDMDGAAISYDALTKIIDILDGKPTNGG